MLRLDWNLVLTIINLLILYLLMKKFLIGPVTAIMEQRQADIEQQFANADKAQKEANEFRTKYEDKLKSSREESVKMIEQARLDAKAEYDKILSEAQEAAGKEFEKSRISLKAEQDQMKREAQSELAALVMAATAKVIGEQNEQMIDRSLYNQFLTKAGDSHDATLN
ncbi:MAG: F0F1 ATP synthase subunit B [Clostridiaceae bacterium]|nr:F0F1 ATP synthase subunit B [Clostridiaceae bacterium]